MLCATSQPCGLFVFVVMICGIVLRIYRGRPVLTMLPMQIFQDHFTQFEDEKLDYSATTLEFSTTVM